MTAAEDHEVHLEDLARTAWGDLPAPLAERRQDDAVVDCGWGRLVFGHTFADPTHIADVLRAEAPGARDICLYAPEPHVVVGTAPNELFIDPSHTYRLDLREGPPADRDVLGVEVREFHDADDADAINLLYQRNGMVTAPEGHIWSSRDDDAITYLVAQDAATGQVIGTVMGVDHVDAFDDPEMGSSLWCLAVDPRTSRPGVGEALTRGLIDRFGAKGRRWMDLSVMHDNEPALRLYEKLGFRRVPVFCVKRKNPINEPLFVPNAVAGLDDLNPYARLIADEAMLRGVEVEVIDAAWGELRLSYGGRSIVTRESLSELTSAIAMSRCDDKRVTRRVLADAGLSVPEGAIATGTDADHLVLAELGEVVVKPARGEQGNGITVGVTDKDALDAAVLRARSVCPDVLIEQRCAGADVRVLVIDHRVVAAAVRQPAAVVGDGRHSVAELIDVQSRRRAAATGGESRIPVDDTTESLLAEMDLTLDSVLDAGRRVEVCATANLHTGGTIHDITDQLHPAHAEAAVLAADALDIPVTGIDLLVPDLAEPDHVIIEANERPGLANHEPQPTAEAFVDLLFPTLRRTR
ncbi:MAG: N-acetylglutaminylglutamine synthetase [Microthrixaceae bacterium]